MAKLEYTEEHEIFRRSAKRFFEEECVPHKEQWDNAGIVPRAVWRKAADNGFLCMAVDEKYGGSGADLLFSVILLEEQIRSGAPAISLSLHNDIVTPYMEMFGTEAQKEKYLPKMASGETIAAIAMTEPGTGSDLMSIKTSAKLDDDGNYIVNGQKTFITNGHLADLILLVVRTQTQMASESISILIVETDGLAGFERGRNLEKLGQKASDTAELFFSDVIVAKSNILGGTEGRGFSQLMNRLAHERLMTGVVAVSTMERAIDLTVEYVKERKAFGQRIFDFQNTRFKLADMVTNARMARLFLNRCLVLSMEGRLDGETAAMLKWWSTEQQCQIVDACLQLHGGYGYMNEYPIAGLWRDSRISKIYGGTNEIMKEIIGRSL